jgi:hypothetical protein
MREALRETRMSVQGQSQTLDDVRITSAKPPIVDSCRTSREVIDRVAIRRARFAKLEVDELTVRKLHVIENSGSMR